MIRNTLNHKYCILCHICYGKISEKIFNTVTKVKLLVSKASNSCFKGLDFFQMLLLLTGSKNTQQVHCLTENKESLQVKFKNFRNRHIILELPTIKTDFLFENSQDFNQTTHARPLFIISVYILTVLVL